MTVQLMLGDCLQRMKEIPDGSVDMVLCDLPYGTTQNKWDAVIPFDRLWHEYNRICKGAVVLFAAQPFTSLLVVSNPDAFRYSWVWDKKSPTGFLNAKRMPMPRTEDILVFSASKAPYNPQGLVYSPRVKKRGQAVGAQNYGKSGSENISEWKGYPTNVLEFVKSKDRGLHPTQKPVALLEYLILTYTDEGQTVLDNTMGSGSTLVAAINTGRNAIGIERDPGYFAIAEKRVAEAQGAMDIPLLMAAE